MFTAAQHSHDYLSDDSTIAANQKKTVVVVIITTAMMIIEIIAGYATGSMALLVDGWHMATHAGALLIAIAAYRLAQSQKLNELFTFGGGKFIPLGGYTNAIALTIVAILMAIESVHRLVEIF